MRIDAYTVIGKTSEAGLSPDELITQMQAARVDKCVIAPVDRCLAVANREGNELVMAAAKKYPDKFIPACTANPWYAKEAIAELNRAIAAGAGIFVLAPHLQGYILNDGTVIPLLEALENHHLPVYVHTGHYQHATPWQLADVALRYPDINFIMGHSGSTDFKLDAVEAALTAPNIYLESSLARSFIFKGMIEKVGPHRGLVGSLAPVNDLGFEWKHMEACLPYEKYRDIYGNNLQRLLGKGK